jgi:hypothetical protein
VEFHSEIFCTSFLVYPVRGAERLSAIAKNIVIAVKEDGRIRYAQGSVSAIAHVAKRLADLRNTNQVIQRCFAGGVVAVPIPRSTPSPPKQPDSLWPAMRICEELQAVGLVQDILPMVVRTRAVTKSATAVAAQRPTMHQHYETIECRTLHTPQPNQRILLVDDVVTRGATMLACFQRLRDVMPTTPIEGFAVARTQSIGDIKAIVLPARQRCYLSGDQSYRDE